jgi:hypothetical protein
LNKCTRRWRELSNVGAQDSHGKALGNSGLVQDESGRWGGGVKLELTRAGSRGLRIRRINEEGAIIPVLQI